MPIQDPIPGLYRHYKGGEYMVICTATHSETGERMVIYITHERDPVPHKIPAFWVRPLTMFCEDVVVDGKIVPRFELIGAAPM